MADTYPATRNEFDGLRSDVTAIKKTLDNHVLSTLKSHGERLDGIDQRLDNVETGVDGLSAEVHHIKAGVDKLTDHFGI